MGSLKSPCTTSYRSSIETIALNCLVFEKIAFLHFGVKIQQQATNLFSADKYISIIDIDINYTAAGCRELKMAYLHLGF